jgi:hypothetical protein
MEAFDNKNQLNHQNEAGIADPSLGAANSSSSTSQSKGAVGQDAALEQSLSSALASDEQQAVPATDDHDHNPTVGNFQLHVSLDQVASARGMDVSKLSREDSFRDNLGAKGDYLNPKGGNNVVIGSGDSDVIRGTGRGFNTITTGTGDDTVILGRETTNRVLDFDAAHDRFVLSGFNPSNIIIAQGKNPGKGGLEQPLDSVNNTLIIDKKTEHILATLLFVKASDLSERNFALGSREANQSLRGLNDEGFKT